MIMIREQDEKIEPIQFAALGFVIGYFIYDSTTEGESSSVAVEVKNHLDVLNMSWHPRSRGRKENFISHP